MSGPLRALTRPAPPRQACKYFLDSHKAAVTYVAFSPDDQQLASSR